MPYKPTEREYRMFSGLEAIQPNEDGKMVVRGYASTYKPYNLLETNDEVIEERIREGAFNLPYDDTIMQYDHQGHVLARTKNGTLTCKADDNGLYIEADLSGTEEGRKLYDEIRGGYIDKMSFGFSVEKDEWEDGGMDGNGRRIYRRTINSFRKIFDVSAVSIPANPDTNIAIRRSFDGAIETLVQELEKRNAHKLAVKRAILRARALQNGGCEYYED